MEIFTGEAAPFCVGIVSGEFPKRGCRNFIYVVYFF